MRGQPQVGLRRLIPTTAWINSLAGPLLVWFYEQRAGAENLIQEANNDAGLAAYPSGRWLMNGNHFQWMCCKFTIPSLCD